MSVITLQDMDDESIIETVDFSEFERLFQVKKSKKQKLKRQDMGKHQKFTIERFPEKVHTLAVVVVSS